MANVRVLLPVFALALALPACDSGNKPSAKQPPASGATPAAGSGAGDGSVAKAAGDAAQPAETADGGEKVKIVEGAPGGDDRYTLQIEPSTDAKAGEVGTVMVKVVPKGPWHMNLEYPTSLKITAPDALAVTKSEMKKADATLDETHCEFAVEFKPAAAGDHEVTGKIKFAVCKDEACSPVTEEVAFKVAVK